MDVLRLLLNFLPQKVKVTHVCDPNDRIDFTIKELKIKEAELEETLEKLNLEIEEMKEKELNLTHSLAPHLKRWESLRITEPLFFWHGDIVDKFKALGVKINPELSEWRILFLALTGRKFWD